MSFATVGSISGFGGFGGAAGSASGVDGGEREAFDFGRGPR